MAIKKYKVEVTRVDEYEIEIDDSIWDKNQIHSWSRVFYPAKNEEDLVKHLAESITHQGIKEMMEGFGHVRQRFVSMASGDSLTQYFPTHGRVPEDEYEKGLLVNIISHNDDYETEVKLLKENKSNDQ